MKKLRQASEEDAEKQGAERLEIKQLLEDKECFQNSP